MTIVLLKKQTPQRYVDQRVLSKVRLYVNALCSPAFFELRKKTQRERLHLRRRDPAREKHFNTKIISETKKLVWTTVPLVNENSESWTSRSCALMMDNPWLLNKTTFLI